MDNAPCHSVHIDRKYQIIKHIPPYLPFLKQIENCFSVLKSDRFQQAIFEAGISVVQRRENILRREITSSMEVKAKEIASSNYRKVDRCLT